MAREPYQLRFDQGRQQRYFPDRRALLAFVARVGQVSADPRFEVWVEGEPVLLADGRRAGRRFEHVETLDLRDAAVRARLDAELDASGAVGDTP